MFKMTVDVNIFEYYDEGPTTAIIEMEDKDLKEIMGLRKLFKKHNLDKVSRYDVTPEMMNKVTDDNGDATDELVESDCRLDCMMLNVTDTSFYWRFSVKNTGINGETDVIYFSDVEEYFKVKEMPLEDLPTLISCEKELIQNLIKERLQCSCMLKLTMI